MAQLVKVSPPGLCQARRPRCNPRSDYQFFQYISPLSLSVCPLILFISSLYFKQKEKKVDSKSPVTGLGRYVKICSVTYHFKGLSTFIIFPQKLSYCCHPYLQCAPKCKYCWLLQVIFLFPLLWSQEGQIFIQGY